LKAAKVKLLRENNLLDSSIWFKSQSKIDTNPGLS